MPAAFWTAIDKENERRLATARRTTRRTFVKITVEDIHACLDCQQRIRFDSTTTRTWPARYVCGCPGKVWRTNFTDSVVEPFSEEELPVESGESPG
jgi:hypothetical protein